MVRYISDTLDLFFNVRIFQNFHIFLRQTPLKHPLFSSFVINIEIYYTNIFSATLDITNCFNRTDAIENNSFITIDLLQKLFPKYFTAFFS